MLALAAVALSLAACERVPLLAPTGSTITLTASTTTLPLSGTTTLIAQVIEPSGTPPHSGTHVSFTTTLGTVQPSEADTDTSGRVAVNFLAGTASGMATITAYSGGVGGATTTTGGGVGGGAATTTPTSGNVVKIAIGAAAVGAVSIASATPNPVSAAGGSSTITANVRDSNGNALAGVPIAWTTDNGSVIPGVSNTDSNGNAQTVLTTSKVAKVTASAGIASGSGSTATTGQTATVTVNVNVVATVTVGAPTPASPSVGQSVTFPLTYAVDAASAQVQNVTVDFGDGTAKQTLPGRAASATHTYALVGSYSVRATLVDALGDTSTGSSSVTVVSPGTVTVGAPAPATPFVGQAVNFPLTYPTSTGTPIARVVADFGDGTAPVTFDGAPGSIAHTFSKIGTFAVQVTPFDSLGNRGGTGSQTVTVTSLPAPTFGSPSPASPTAGQTVTFPITYATGTTSAIQRVVVNWGDNSSPQTFNGAPSSIPHQFDQTKVFGITATFFDVFGNSVQTSTTINVAARPVPTVAITINTTNPTADTDVQFSVTITPATGTTIDSGRVNFGDGSGQELPSGVSGTIVLHHAYKSLPTGGSATYTMTVTATDSNGGQGSGVTTVFVQVAPPLTVALTATTTPAPPNTTATFTATVTGLGNDVVVLYHWVFGSTLVPADTTANTVTRTYPAGAGTVTVSVTITTSSGKTQSAQTVIIVP